MSQEKLTVPTMFRGLRILLIDSDTESLLHLASKLESCSYRVTTTELPTIALSILRERADRFDLIMAEIEMPEMDCFNFINRVHLIKDLPIILISAESKKSVIEEAMTKGACFFLKKPISTKNLKNVWQHVYRKAREMKIKNGDDQAAESQVAKAEKKQNVVEIVEEEEHFVGSSNRAENNRDGLAGGVTNLRNSTRVEKKRSASSETFSEEVGEIKRRRMEGNQELADLPNFQASFLELLEETDFLDCSYRKE